MFAEIKNIEASDRELGARRRRNAFGFFLKTRERGPGNDNNNKKRKIIRTHSRQGVQQDSVFPIVYNVPQFR